MCETAEYLYIFLDEGGNLDFSPSGTKYFTLSAVTKTRPFVIEPALLSLKYDLIECGLGIEHFHASEDRQAVRDTVFDVIRANLANVQIDSVVVEKGKTEPALRPVEKFFPQILGYLLRNIADRASIDAYKEVIVITDSLPVRHKRKAIEGGIKTVLKEMLPKQAKYRVLHHPSSSAIGLQVADYSNWAIYRKWESGDSRSYDIVASAISSEVDVFESGMTEYYQTK